MQAVLLDRLRGDLADIKRLSWLKVQHEELHELCELPIKFSIELMAPFGKENIVFFVTLDAGYPSLPPIIDCADNGPMRDQVVTLKILDDDWSRSCKCPRLIKSVLVQNTHA
jgi:hypothetical protein